MAEVLSPAGSLGSLEDYGLPGNATAAEWRAKYVEAADMLQEARGELEDFMTSSKELEEELLRELERTEKTQKELKDKVNGTEVDRDNWKNKFMNLQTTHNTAVNSLHRDLDTLRQEHQKIKVQLRDLEMGNDDLERTEREISSSLQDAEARYARVLEEKILLEQELLAKASLEEACQRLRDDLRDANAEVHVLRDQLENLKNATPATTDPSPHPSTNTLPTNSTDDDLLIKTPPPLDLQLSDLTPVPSFGQAHQSSSPPSSRPQSMIMNTSRPSSAASGSSLGQAALLQRAGFPTPTATTPTQSTIRATSTISPSRLPAPRTPRVNTITQRPTLASSTSSFTGKSKGVQMVTDMRARVKILEQKLHSRVPRVRNTSIRAPAVDRSLVHRTASPAQHIADKSVGADSPGWVLIMEESPTPASKPTASSSLGVTTDASKGPTPPSAFRTYSGSPTNESPSTSAAAAAASRIPFRPPSRLSASGYHHSSIPQPSSRPTTPTFLPMPTGGGQGHNRRQSIPSGRRSSLGASLPPPPNFHARPTSLQPGSVLGQSRSLNSNTRARAGGMPPPPVPPLPPPKDPSTYSVSGTSSSAGSKNSLFKSTNNAAKNLLATSRIGRPMSLGTRRGSDKDKDGKRSALGNGVVSDPEGRLRSGSVA